MTTFSTGKPRGEDSVPSILRLFIQILIHPQRRFGNPLRTFWAILCEPFSPKSRFFLDTPKFYTLYAGSPNVPPRVLAVWAKTLRGQLKMPLNTDFSLKSLLNAFTPPGRKESSPATPSVWCRFLSTASTASL